MIIFIEVLINMNEKLIFEIHADQIVRRTLYAYCKRHDFDRIRSTNKNFYYVKTKNEKDRKMLTEYLNERSIQYFIYLNTDEVKKWIEGK